MKFQDLKFKADFVYVDNHGHEWVLDSERVNFIHHDYGTLLTTHYNQRDLLELDFERVISWDKVPIDTKIFVRDDESDEWIPRHFAGYENGLVQAFPNGRSSFTLGDYCDRLTSWIYAKLAETVD